MSCNAHSRHSLRLANTRAVPGGYVNVDARGLVAVALCLRGPVRSW